VIVSSAWDLGIQLSRSHRGAGGGGPGLPAKPTPEGPGVPHGISIIVVIEVDIHILAGPPATHV
jgi:hypothetical protein